MRKSILFSFLLLFSSCLVFAQEPLAVNAEPSAKEKRKQKKAERVAAYELKKAEALEMIKGGDFVLVANQLTRGGTKKTRAFPTSNFVKVEGNIVYIQIRHYGGSGQAGQLTRMISGEIQDIQVFDKGKGKNLKVRIRFGFRTTGNYELVDLHIGNKTAQARLGMGETYRLEGYYSRDEDVFIDGTQLEMERLRFVHRDTGSK